MDSETESLQEAEAPSPTSSQVQFEGPCSSPLYNVSPISSPIRRKEASKFNRNDSPGETHNNGDRCVSNEESSISSLSVSFEEDSQQTEGSSNEDSVRCDPASSPSPSPPSSPVMKRRRQTGHTFNPPIYVQSHQSPVNMYDPQPSDSENEEQLPLNQQNRSPLKDNVAISDCECDVSQSGNGSTSEESIHCQSIIDSAGSDNSSVVVVNQACDSDLSGSSSSSVINSDEGDEQINDNNQHFLYPGSTKRVDCAVLEIQDIYLKNKWTKHSLEETLRFFVSCLPPNHEMPRTLYFLFKYLKTFTSKAKPIYHYYCKKNLHHLPLNIDKCTHCDCSDICVFFELPIKEQIKYLFENRHLASVIDKYRESSNRVSKDGLICDIVDGSEYKRIRNTLKGPYDVMLILNTDGIKPHISSTAKLWPLMFTIVEVPPALRSSFIVVSGIWFDPKHKPNMEMYLSPFVDSLTDIFLSGGVDWVHPETGVSHTSQVAAPLLIADAPARADVLGMQSHGGKYACNLCEQKTRRLQRPPDVQGQERPKQQRRFFMQEIPAKLRTHARMVIQGQFATENRLVHNKTTMDTKHVWCHNILTRPLQIGAVHKVRHAFRIWG